jgi:hypothetical protein
VWLAGRFPGAFEGRPRAQALRDDVGRMIDAALQVGAGGGYWGRWVALWHGGLTGASLARASLR